MRITWGKVDLFNWPYFLTAGRLIHKNRIASSHSDGVISLNNWGDMTHIMRFIMMTDIGKLDNKIL